MQIIAGIALVEQGRNDDVAFSQNFLPSFSVANGLGFDQADIDYYHELFCADLKRKKMRCLRNDFR